MNAKRDTYECLTWHIWMCNVIYIPVRRWGFARLAKYCMTHSHVCHDSSTPVRRWGLARLAKYNIASLPGVGRKTSATSIMSGMSIHGICRTCFVTPSTCSMIGHTCESVISHIWMSHDTYMNESCHTYECLMSHMWMRHVTHMNASCHMYEWVMYAAYIYTHSHVCPPTCGMIGHTYRYVMQIIWMRHITNTNVSCHTWTVTSIVSLSPPPSHLKIWGGYD